MKTCTRCGVLYQESEQQPHPCHTDEAPKWAEFFVTLRRIESKVDDLRKEVKMADETLDQVLQDTTDESTVDDSIITLLNGIAAQLKTALAAGGGTITAAQQAEIDQIFTNLEANKAKLAAAITANTPAAPTT